MDDPFITVAKDAMLQVWGRNPRHYQSFVISHILRMMAKQTKPDPVLLVQSTGSGKSSIPLTCAVVDGGVSIIIENTLALSSDQASKVNTQANTDSKKVRAFQLDLFNTKEQQQQLSTFILNHCKDHNDSSIILFTSPETLLQDVWIEFLQNCITKSILRLFCIDEIHLFVEFGLSFRSDFQLLKTKVITLLHENGRFIVPIVFMTATFNNNLLHLLQRMLGIQFMLPNIFWGSVHSFSKRHISISIRYSKQQFKLITTQINEKLQRDIKNKHIIISSTAQKVNEMQQKLDSWLDKNNHIKGDTVTVIGSHSPELKQGYTTLFTNTVFNTIDDYSENNLCPRFLMGTPGCIGAGLDCSSVTLVSRLGLPTSIIHFIQEMGRCGRDVSNQNAINEYSIIFQLSDYVYLVERLYTINDDDQNATSNETNNVRGAVTSLLSKDEERLIELQNIHSLCRLLFLNFGCWHRQLELASASPFTAHYNYQCFHCNNSCPYCNQSINDIVKPVNRRELGRFLVDTLLINCIELYTPAQLAKKLQDYPSVGTKIYGRQSGQTCEKPSDSSVTILQLLCTNILSLNIKESKKPKAYVSVCFTDDVPNYLNNDYWVYIKTIDA